MTKKNTQFSELKVLSNKELISLLRKTKTELVQLRMGISLKVESRAHLLKEAKTKVAQIHTLLTASSESSKSSA